MIKNENILTPIFYPFGEMKETNTKTIWKTARTCGGIKECLETEQPITQEAALYLIKSLYKFYCFDDRIKAKRYILKNMQYNLGLPTWIHEYEVEVIENDE